MKALTYIEHGKFSLMDKPKPEVLSLIEADKIDTTPLITHRYKLDGVIKVAVTPN